MKKRNKYLLGAATLLTGGFSLWSSNKDVTLESKVIEVKITNRKPRIDFNAINKVLSENKKQTQAVVEDEVSLCFPCDNLTKHVKTTHYNDGQKKSEKTLVCNIRHGPHKRWDKKGNLVFEENYQCNKRHGKRIKKSPEGMIISKENFFEGKLEDKQYAWHKNGRKSHELNFHNNKKLGKQFSWDEKGQLIVEEDYNEEGRKDGIQIYRYPNGMKRLIVHFADGKKQGPELGWYENGQKEFIKKNVNGKEHGEQLFWYEHGQFRGMIAYDGGVKLGRLLEYDEDGNLLDNCNNCAINLEE